MPTREYECLECKKVFEVQQKISEPKLTRCDECGGELQALIGFVSVKFKGAGFHVNDYGKRGPR